VRFLFAIRESRSPRGGAGIYACGEAANPAKYTQRLIGSEDLIVTGAAGMYEARCRHCFEPNLAAMEAVKKKRMEAVAG
jgi:thymidine kinase